MTEQVIAITRCVSRALMPQKCISVRGGPAGGAYRPLAGFEGTTLPAYAYKSAALL